MSKNKKLKNKNSIPYSMRGRVFSSPHDLGSALGLKTPEQPTPKSKNCRKCGNPMRQVPGTNVWICYGMVEEEKNGVKGLVPCGNRAITSVLPTPQSSENPGNFKPKKQSNPVQTATA